jgi:hypothetical protein
MLSKADQAASNLDHARDLRANGLSYRDIRRQLAISPAQLAHIRRALKREKSARTRMLNQNPLATARDIPLRQTALPLGLRTSLVAAGVTTLGHLSDKLADEPFSGLLSIPGIGPHKARLVLALLERHDLASPSGDLQRMVEHLFPDLIAD